MGLEIKNQIKELEEKLNRSIKVYGKNFFNESVENQRKELKLKLKILKDKSK